MNIYICVCVKIINMFYVNMEVEKNQAYVE